MFCLQWSLHTMLLQAKESSILLSHTMLINCVSYLCNPRENNCRSMQGIFPDSIQLNWMSPAPYKVSKRQPLNEQHLESKTISAISSTVCNWFEGHQITMNSRFNSKWLPSNSQCILRVISSWHEAIIGSPLSWKSKPMWIWSFEMRSFGLLHLTIQTQITIQTHWA